MADLYDEDLLLWSKEQARALRSAAHSGANLAIDWENVAEEIESLGKSLARELASWVSTILTHLMKLEASPATEPRIGWPETIREQRDQIERVLKEAPSLRQTVPAVIEEELVVARKRVRASLADYGERPAVELEQLAYSTEQVLGPWHPGAKRASCSANQPIEPNLVIPRPRPARRGRGMCPRDWRGRNRTGGADHPAYHWLSACRWP
jgi:Domain of unknown function DUF29